MIQQTSLAEALALLSELSAELKKHKQQEEMDAEFEIQKGSITKIRALLASLDQMFSPRKSLIEMNGNR